MRLMLLAAAIAAGLFVSKPASAQSADGIWRTESGDAYVRVAACGSALCGTIVWLRNPIDPETGRPVTDKNNPDPAKRSNPMIGTQIMFGMRPNGTGRWTGFFYNSKDGKTYDGNLVLLGATSVKAEGCLIGICLGETWQRVEGAKVTKPARKS